MVFRSSREGIQRPAGAGVNDMEYRQLPLVAVVPATRADPMSQQELEREEDQAMVDIAGFIRSRLVSLPATSCVVRDLGHWADLLAAAGAARLPEYQALAAVRSA